MTAGWALSWRGRQYSGPHGQNQEWCNVRDNKGRIVSGKSGLARPDITEQMRDEACESILYRDERVYMVARRLNVSTTTVKQWLSAYCTRKGIERKRIVHRKPYVDEETERKRAEHRKHDRMMREARLHASKQRTFDDAATEELRRRALDRAFYG